MTYVLRIDRFGGNCPPEFEDLARSHEGRYVARYDPDDDHDPVATTDDPSDALTFASASGAMACWRRPSTRRPFRTDGKPNRPLTAYTVTVEPLTDR